MGCILCLPYFKFDMRKGRKQKIPLELLKEYAETKNTNTMAINLTGTYSSDITGTYYIKQIGKLIYWMGEQSEVSPAWCNIATGTIDANNVLQLEWADVPKGATANHGELNLKASDDGKIIKVQAETGGFGTRVLTRK